MEENNQRCSQSCGYKVNICNIGDMATLEATSMNNGEIANSVIAQLCDDIRGQNNPVASEFNHNGNHLTGTYY